MFLYPLMHFSFVLIISLVYSQDLNNFTFNGFKSANLTLNGIAKFEPNGLLVLTNGTLQKTGHAFFPVPIRFKNVSSGSVLSFSTAFVFSIIPQYPTNSGHGIAFVVAPTPGLQKTRPSQHLGLFNESNNGNFSNHVVAVELDTIYNDEFKDINENHVGIDINGLISKQSEPAGYYIDKSNQTFQNLSLISGEKMQVWVEYDGSEKKMYVTIAPINITKPSRPLLSLYIDLSPFLKRVMYVGFSSATGSATTRHYILGWSFRVNGVAEDLDLSQLPPTPSSPQPPSPPPSPPVRSTLRNIGIAIILALCIFVVVSGVVYYIRRKRKFAEVLEDWEVDYGPHRFKYKDLYISTKGFREKGLLGMGGFGRVYKGILPKSKVEIAVKRVSHESRQGMREFVAEVVSIGRLRHRNLVQLLGYCRRRGELLLVYEYMPNGSLDKLLYDQPESKLDWDQRFKIIKGVASGLLYLHEEWEQVVIHRDVKASNVLLDGELNGKLGDFGLARLSDHGTDPQTTLVVGTLGYLSPEHTRTGRATTRTDVYAFGAFLLEVACGRRPIDPHAPQEDIVLVDYVFQLWSRRELLKAVDKNLGDDYVAHEAEIVLRLGLVCSQSEPLARPSMREVVRYLEGDISLPDLMSLGFSATALSYARHQGFEDFTMSYPSLIEGTFSHSTNSVADSILSQGR